MNHRMPGLSLGFTLLELTITVAVIGLLAAIAVPAYQDFSIRSKVSEALNMGSAAKSAVIDAASRSGLGAVTAAAMDSSLSSRPSPFVEEIAIEDGGRIVMKTRDTGAEPDPELWLVPSQAGGAITWECRVADPASIRHVPPICRNLDSSSTGTSSFAPDWIASSQCGPTTTEKVTVEVTPKDGGGFKTKPVATSDNPEKPNPCFVSDPQLREEKLTRGQPALVDMSPTVSGQFDLQVHEVKDSKYGGWGVALASDQDPFSGYTIQFETMDSRCGGKGPCMVLVEWANGKEGARSPAGSLPPDYSVSKPGSVSVKVDGSDLKVSVGGEEIFKSDSLKGDQWVFGVRSWNGAILDVGGSKITTP